MLHPWVERNVSPPPLVRAELLRYYAPYALGLLLLGLFMASAAVPSQWWLVAIIQAGVLSCAYYMLLRRNDMKAMLLPALVVGVLGLLHFMVINGAVYRWFNALVISLALAAHLRGMLRAYSFPNVSLAPYRLFIASFLASLAVYMALAVTGAGVSLLQFPWWGAAGIIFLVTWTVTRQFMALTVLSPSVQAKVQWVLSSIVGECAALLLFLPTLPMVAGALVLSLYAPFLEVVRTPASLPSRRTLWWGGAGICALWVLTLASARWP